MNQSPPRTDTVTEPEVLAECGAELKLRADAARNRQRVLDAAATVFAQRGLEASLDDVAACAGVGVGTVYRRFPNKEALVEALFEGKVAGMVTLAREAAEFEDPWEGFVHFLEQALRWQVENRGLRDVLLHSSFGRDRVAGLRESIAPILGEVIERAQRAGRLRPDLVVNDVPMLVTMIGAVSDYVGCCEPGLWERYFQLILDSLVASRISCGELGDPPTQQVVDTAMLNGR